jgi:hypothetical protein
MNDNDENVQLHPEPLTMPIPMSRNLSNSHPNLYLFEIFDRLLLLLLDKTGRMSYFGDI